MWEEDNTLSGNFFDNLEKKTNISRDDIFRLANRVSQANFQDEETVRTLIADVARLANVNVSKEKEEQIIEAIVNNKIPADLSQLTNMINKK